MTMKARQEAGRLKIKALGILNERKGRDNITTISAYILADAMGVHYSTADSLITALETMGAISVIEITGTFNKVYTIRILARPKAK